MAEEEIDINEIDPQFLPPEVRHQASPHQRSGLAVAGDVAEGLFTRPIQALRFPAFAGGLLQGVGDIGASIANLPMRLSGVPERVPHPNLRKYLPPDMLTSAAFGLGQLPAYAAPFGAGIGGRLAGAIGEALPTASRFPKLSSLLSRGAVGGGIGAGIDEAHPGMGAALGGIGLPVARIPGALGEFSASMHPENIASDVLKTKVSNQAKYSDLYDDIVKQGQSLGFISKRGLSKDLIKDFAGIASKRERAELSKFLEKPTFENAHDAQSDLWKFTRRINSIPELRELGPHRDAVNAATQLRDALRNNMVTKAISKGKPEIGERYAEIGKGYKEEVVPYLGKHFDDYASRKLFPKDFVNKLSKDRVFMEDAAVNHPGLVNSLRFGGLPKTSKEALMTFLKYGPGIGAVGLGGTYLANKFSQEAD